MTQQQSKYLFTVTNFDEDPDLVATPLVLANSALAGGGDVLLWLTADGAHLARKDAAESVKPKSFPPVAELLKTYTDNGGRIGICPPCGKSRGVTEENMVANGEWMGALALLVAARERQAFSF